MFLVLSPFRDHCPEQWSRKGDKTIRDHRETFVVQPRRIFCSKMQNPDNTGAHLLVNKNNIIVFMRMIIPSMNEKFFVVDTTNAFPADALHCEM